MWLNRNTNTKIHTPTAIKVGSIQHPASIFSKWSEAELNSINVFTIEKSGSIQSRRYYSQQTTEDMVSTPPTITINSIDLDIDIVKEKMLKDISTKFKEVSLRPTVSTTLGVDVDASRNDILNFEDGKILGILFVKDANGVKQTITLSDWDIIINECKVNGLNLYNTKWDKEDEINAFTTVQECILYENTPYDYTLTTDDVSNGFLIGNVGDIVTRYKNNTLEW